MNTVEKRKLEALVASKLSAVREVYRHRRQTEYEALSSQLEIQPPQKVQETIDKAKKIQSTFIAEATALTAAAEAQGYTLNLHINKHIDVNPTLRHSGRWINGEYCRAVTEPSLLAHSNETNKNLAALDDISARYNVEIWSETADMKNLFEKFTKEIEKLV